MASNRHPIEPLVEWGSAALLSFAAGFFVRVAVGGADEMLALVASLGAALAAGAGAMAIQRRVERPRWPHATFDLSPIEQLVAEPALVDELLLTDPLDAPPDDSRVVRLFAPETLQVPGELAGRIDVWLDGARSRLETRRDQPSPGHGHGHGPRASEASAALHAALADIRRSLG